MPRVYLALVAFLMFSAISYAQQGCCSLHGGVCGCCDAAPRDVGPALGDFGRESLDRFADDFELADRRIVSVGLGHEFVMAHGSIALDLLDGIEHVLQVGFVSAHRGTASDRTCSRI